MNSKKSNGTVIVLGIWRSTLSVIRSLGRANYKVVLIKIPGGKYLEASRYTDQVIELEGFQDDPEKFFSPLSSIFPIQGEKVYLFPVGDPEIIWTTNNAHYIPEHISLVTVLPEVYKTCASKVKLFSIAEQAGVPCLTNVVANHISELVPAADQIGYPCIVKADTEIKAIFGKKVARVDSKEILQSLVNQASPNGSHKSTKDIPFIVQAFSHGIRFNVYFFAQKGKMLGNAQVKILRTNEYDDTGLAVHGVIISPREDLQRFTRNLVSALNYEGAGCAQYLIEEDTQEITFLEINARLGANFSNVYQAGLDLPLLFVQSIEGKTIGPQTQGEINKYFAWLLGDLMGLLKAVKKNQISGSQFLIWFFKMIRAQIRSKHHVTWDIKDPLPSFYILYDRFMPWRQNPSI